MQSPTVGLAHRSAERVRHLERRPGGLPLGLRIIGEWRLRQDAGDGPRLYISPKVALMIVARGDRGPAWPSPPAMLVAVGEEVQEHPVTDVEQIGPTLRSRLVIASISRP